MRFFTGSTFRCLTRQVVRVGFRTQAKKSLPTKTVPPDGTVACMRYALTLLCPDISGCVGCLVEFLTRSYVNAHPALNLEQYRLALRLSLAPKGIGMERCLPLVETLSLHGVVGYAGYRGRAPGSSSPPWQTNNCRGNLEVGSGIRRPSSRHLGCPICRLIKRPVLSEHQFGDIRPTIVEHCMHIKHKTRAMKRARLLCHHTADY